MDVIATFYPYIIHTLSINHRHIIDIHILSKENPRKIQLIPSLSYHYHKIIHCLSQFLGLDKVWRNFGSTLYELWIQTIDKLWTN